jgi:hypothetical protein
MTIQDLGGSPLLQQRGATLQRCGKELDFDMRFSAGFPNSGVLTQTLKPVFSE